MGRESLMIAGLLVSANAWAGVTIHFNGQLKDPGAARAVGIAACEAAKRQSWGCVPVSHSADPALDAITLKSLRGDSAGPDPAVAQGVVIYPAGMSEPLYLVFDHQGKVDNFIKTQFAGPDTHIAVIGVLDAIAPFFSGLMVEDEGRYWETRDRAYLEQDMASVSAQIEAIRAMQPNLTGPVKRPDGRILDLVAGKR